MLNKHKIEYFLFISIGKLLSLSGYNSIHKTAKIFAYIFFNIIRIRRDVVINNLTIAFPELNKNQIKDLALKNYSSIAVTFLEVFNLKSIGIEGLKENFRDDGFDFIKEKYKEGNGLIFLTAHYGNWEIGAIAAGVHLEESIQVLVKRQKNRDVANWLSDFREMYGNVQINLGTSVRELYKTIKDKKAVGIVGDQRGKRDGVKVQFFGRQTSTFPGTAAIALKTKCPVIVLLCSRQDDGKYKAFIRELKFDHFEGTLEEQVQMFNQTYMSILEENIKQYPEQWFWMHNIWKY